MIELPEGREDTRRQETRTIYCRQILLSCAPAGWASRLGSPGGGFVSSTATTLCVVGG